jgi:uncharacterized protein YceH (UPF0502 family)
VTGPSTATAAVQLSAPQGRVVGCLIEKQLTTPQQYPLTANALVLACNQASNRHPVVDYGEDEVSAVLDELREQRLVRFVLPSHGRSVVRYRHVLDEVLGIDAPQLALLAVLLLRGPQTVGELRTRTERMTAFDSLGDVEHELDLLVGAEPPLVVRLDRRPGQKEERWADLLQAEAASPAEDVWDLSGSPTGSQTGTPPPGAPPPLAEEVAALRQEVVALRADVDALRSSLGG